mmetsp:Transcript_15186/g.25006  ORF Transcript_15186/g.25006 Transcript_15186/m.25006 type:complete len:270 (+) Transcript_15186:88-897(+)
MLTRILIFVTFLLCFNAAQCRTQSDYYSRLGVKRSASTDEIGRAYRELSKHCHPDTVAPNKKIAAHSQFQELAEAYEVLKDPARRDVYDATLGLGKGGNTVSVRVQTSNAIVKWFRKTVYAVDGVQTLWIYAAIVASCFTCIVTSCLCMQFNPRIRKVYIVQQVPAPPQPVTPPQPVKPSPQPLWQPPRESDYQRRERERRENEDEAQRRKKEREEEAIARRQDARYTWQNFAPSNYHNNNYSDWANENARRVGLYGGAAERFMRHAPH